MIAKPRVCPDGAEWISVLVKEGVVIQLARAEAESLRDELEQALRSFDNPKDVKPLRSADHYFAELEHVHGEVVATMPAADRPSLPKLLHRGRYYTACAEHMHAAVDACGWDEVVAAVRWGWGRVRDGKREPKFQAALFRAEGSFPRLYEEYRQATKKAQEVEQERRKREAEKADEAERVEKFEEQQEVVVGLLEEATRRMRG